MAEAKNTTAVPENAVDMVADLDTGARVPDNWQAPDIKRLQPVQHSVRDPEAVFPDSLLPFPG